MCVGWVWAEADFWEGWPGPGYSQGHEAEGWRGQVLSVFHPQPRQSAWGTHAAETLWKDPWHPGTSGEIHYNVHVFPFWVFKVLAFKHNYEFHAVSLQGDLGAIDEKYDVAISSSCGALDNIVVDTIDTAQKCVTFLKAQNIGVATFIGLDKVLKLFAWVFFCVEQPVVEFESKHYS